MHLRTGHLAEVEASRILIYIYDRTHHGMFGNSYQADTMPPVRSSVADALTPCRSSVRHDPRWNLERLSVLDHPDATRSCGPIVRENGPDERIGPWLRPLAAT